MNRALILTALIVAGGCKSPGEIGVTLTYDTATTCDPAAATHWLAYAIADGNCDDCYACGCLGQCDAGTCEVACNGDACAPEPSAIDLAPGPGSWAVVIEMYDLNDALIATGCKQLVFDDDGTSDQAIELPIACVSIEACQPP